MGKVWATRVGAMTVRVTKGGDARLAQRQPLLRAMGCWVGLYGSTGPLLHDVEATGVDGDAIGSDNDAGYPPLVVRGWCPANFE